MPNDYAPTSVLNPVEKEGLQYQRVIQQITSMIDAGTFRTGDRLPSVRQLGQQLGLAVGTILHAYRLLETQRRIEARPQSGYYVRRASPPLAVPAASTPSGRVGKPTVGQLVMKMTSLIGDADVVPLGQAIPAADCLPTRQLNRLSAAIARRSSRGSNFYDVPPGSKELRTQVARHYAEANCALSPDDIVTTCGCQEALGLCLRAVAGPGGVVAVDAPCYYGQLQTIELLGMKALEIPTDPQAGVDLDALRQALRTKKIAACLFTTNCHNPLGFIMAEPKKRQLVELLVRDDVPLIEDDTYGDLAFDSVRPGVCKAFDREGRVLLCSSFSKTLAPGARVGWCAPGRYLEDVKRLKFCNTIATPTLPQLAIAEFLAVGGYGHHLRKLRKHYAGQVQLVSQLLQQYFPPLTRVTRPAGGHVLWVELPKKVDAVKLFEAAVAKKISVAPGPLFSASNGYRNFIRLNCSCPSACDLEGAIKTLATLVTAAAN